MLNNLQKCSCNFFTAHCIKCIPFCHSTVKRFKQLQTVCSQLVAVAHNCSFKIVLPHKSGWYCFCFQTMTEYCPFSKGSLFFFKDQSIGTYFLQADQQYAVIHLVGVSLFYSGQVCGHLNTFSGTLLHKNEGTQLSIWAKYYIATQTNQIIQIQVRDKPKIEIIKCFLVFPHFFSQ